MTSAIHGVYSASATPLDAAGAPDRDLLIGHARQLLADGCDGIAVLGTTGEANSFSIAERQHILESLVGGGIDPARLMPGTGLCAIPDTIALTRHALAMGVTNVLMLPPFYYKQPSDEGLFAAYAAVIDSVADARLRIVLYHIPPMSAVPLSLPLIERLIARYPTTVVAIKDSSGDLANMEAMVRAFPGFAVLSGSDPLMLPLLRKGGAGCITAVSNLAGRELATVYRHFADPAKSAAVDAAQARVARVREIATRFAQIPTVKNLLARRYGAPDWTRVRPPLVTLDAAAAAEIGRQMGEMADMPSEFMA